MGLFDKKLCCICGNKAGMLSRQKLMDKTYICGDCREKCSPQLTWRGFERMVGSDVVAHMQYVVENEELYRTHFQETYAICTGILGSSRVISIDEQNGWWVIASSRKPDILTFDQIISYHLDITTHHLTDEERRDPNRKRMHVMPPYGLPGCGPHDEITGMKVIVRLNHPWLDQVELDVLNAIFVTEGDIRAAYECTQQLFLYFDQQRAAAACQQAYSAPVYAAPTYAAPVSPVAPAAPFVPAAPASPVVPVSPAATAAPSQAEAIEMLKKFKELLDMGAITQEEFDAKKKQLLGL